MLSPKELTYLQIIPGRDPKMSPNYVINVPIVSPFLPLVQFLMLVDHLKTIYRLKQIPSITINMLLYSQLRS